MSINCQECAKIGVQSFVNRTPEPKDVEREPINDFWDANNVWHHHDPNGPYVKYQCTKGHVWWEVMNYCPACEANWLNTKDKKFKTQQAVKDQLAFQAAEEARIAALGVNNNAS